MLVYIETTPTESKPFDSSGDKQTDLSKPGNRRWLLSHIRWAARNKMQVVIRPSL